MSRNRLHVSMAERIIARKKLSILNDPEFIKRQMEKVDRSDVATDLLKKIETRQAYMMSDKNKPGWILKKQNDDGGMWLHFQSYRSIIASIAKEDDGRWWIHASIAHANQNRMPRYEELAMMKKNWIGEDHKAIMIFAEKKHHVNIRNNALHLFSCIDEDVLPEFSSMGTL